MSVGRSVGRSVGNGNIGRSVGRSVGSSRSVGLKMSKTERSVIYGTVEVGID